MADTFSEIASAVMNIIKRSVRADALTVDEFRKTLEINMEFHKAFVDATSVFSPKDLDMFRKNIEKYRNVDSNKIISFYDELIKNYDGKAKDMEIRVPFSAIIEANRAMIKLLQDINKRLDDLFQEDFITVENVTISNTMVFGILQQSYILGKYSSFIWTELIKLSTELDITTKKYKIEFLKENTKPVSGIVSRVVSKAGTFSILQDIAKLKQDNNDLLLFANGNPFTRWITKNKVRDNFDSLGFATKGFAIIAWNSKRRDDKEYARYLELRDTVEWLQTHTTVLRSDLDNLDHNSPQRKKLEKIIENYDAKIADYNKRIEAYLNAD